VFKGMGETEGIGTEYGMPRVKPKPVTCGAMGGGDMA